MPHTYKLSGVDGVAIENPTVHNLAVCLSTVPYVDENRYPKYEGIFVIEYRDGAARRHYRGYAEAGEQILAVFDQLSRGRRPVA
jgi:hypothetical protein